MVLASVPRSQLFKRLRSVWPTPNRIGVANASISTANDLGIGLGAIILGSVSQYASYKVLFIVSALSVAISLILFTLFAKRSLQKKPSLHAESLSLESR